MSLSWLNAIHHDGSEKYVSNLNPRLNETVKIHLRTGENAPIREVYVRTAPDGEQAFIPMTPVKSESPVQWWEADIFINEPCVNYRFLIVAEDGVWFFSAAGITDYDPLDATDFRILVDYHPPGWLQDTVFYQIFPDNFANGDPSLNPTPDAFEYAGHRPQPYAWGEPLPEGAPYSQSYYGGDLPGIAQHLDYLETLGVNAIYLNPIFTAYSCHRYDIVNYNEVDPFLGGNEALVTFRQALSVRGMRYILDIVPNHCGVAHPWFLAAQADKTAPELEFFTFTRYPDEYIYWGPYRNLVKLNFQSVALRRRMYENPGSTFRRWLKPPYSADGWRVDVGNMLGRQGAIQMNADVIRGIRAAVKAVRPDAYLMGENFHDASAQLQGDQWDGVMNYSGLSRPLMNWLKGFEAGAIGFQGTINSPVPFPTTALAATWRTRRAAIPWVIALQQFNLLSSHDTSRVRSALGENDALHRLTVTVQLTFPGVPCIYYGDEIGMVDIPGVTPMSGSSRACMIWDKSRWNHDLLHFFRNLIARRRQSPILQRGGFQMLWVENDTFAYQREGTEGHIIVVAHRSETPRPASGLPVWHGGIADGTLFVEHFSGHEAVVKNGRLPLPEQCQGATLWQTE